MLLYVGVLLIFGRLSWVAGRFTADTIEGIDSVWYTTEPIKDKDGGGGGWLYGCEGGIWVHYEHGKKNWRIRLIRVQLL